MTSRVSLHAALADRLGSANEARWMLEEVLGTDADGDDDDAEADEDALRALSDMADRRLSGEPFQYVLGSWQFRTVELSVDPRALIPRPETEQVVELAIAEARRQLATASITEPGAPFLVADLGTGSGAIALSIAVELGADRPRLRVAATDVDASAIGLAAVNRDRLSAGHPHVAEQVDLREGSWFDALPAEWRGGVHLVVSNPPYVSEDEWATLDPQVRCEPYGALVAAPGSDGAPGFAAAETVLTSAREWLAPGGAVVVEMAPHQTGAARELATRAGYAEVRVERDLAGRQRALVARR
ncbi:MAG: peptide chain release factor N(5)-glutamine methyltransferase [Acidimicrobiales bacterium]